MKILYVKRTMHFLFLCVVVLISSCTKAAMVEVVSVLPVPGLIPKAFGNKMGYVNDNDSTIIEPRFEMALEFEANGLAIESLNQKWGFINQKGEFAIQPVFDALREFSFELAPALSGTNWGYINLNGSFFIEPRFNAVENVSANGLAVAALDAETISTTQTQYDLINGYIRRDGKFAIQPSFRRAFSFEGDSARVITNHSQELYINEDGVAIDGIDNSDHVEEDRIVSIYNCCP